MRTFMVVYEQILGASSTAYTNQLHDWYMQGLSKKSAPGTVQDTATLVDKDALSMQKDCKGNANSLGRRMYSDLEYSLCSAVRNKTGLQDLWPGGH